MSYIYTKHFFKIFHKKQTHSWGLVCEKIFNLKRVKQSFQSSATTPTPNHREHTTPMIIIIVMLLITIIL